MSMEFSRQEYWSGLPFPPPGDLPDPAIKSGSPALPADSLPSAAAAAAAKSLQLCPTLCDPIDGSPPGSPIPEILQARTLEWVAMSFSNEWKWKVKVKVKSLSHIQLLATPWTAAYQAAPSMGFSRQEYWSGVPSPSPLPSEPPVYLPNSRQSENIFLFLLHINSDLAMKEFILTLFSLETL